MTQRSIHETIGLVAVLAGLVFVGLELRQNNALAQAAAYQAIGLSTAEAWSTIAENPELNRLNSESSDSAAIARWTPEEWARYGAFVTSWARRAETALLQVEEGLLPVESMELLGYSGLGQWLENPGLACVWPRIQGTVGPSLRDAVRGESETVPDCVIELPEFSF